MRILEKYTIPTLLDYAFDRFSQNNSFSFVDHQQQIYADLQQQVAEVGNMLLLKGIEKGDKVAILATNSPNWIVAYCSISSIGAVVVPILPDFTDKEIIAILEHSEAKALFVSERLYKKVEQKKIDLVEMVFSLENFACSTLSNSSDEFKKLPAPTLSSQGFSYNYSIEEDDLLSIIYTSGTTGQSKGVMLSHKNILWDVERGKELQKVGETDSFLSILPLSHTYESSIGMLLSIMSGASVYYLEKPPVPSVLMSALKKVRPTIMLTVPLIMEKIYRGKVLAEINKKTITKWLYKVPFFRRKMNKLAGKKVYESFGGRLHFFGIGGAKLDATVEQFLIDAKFPYAIGYGMTETSPLIAGALVGKTKLGSAGEFISHLEYRIAKEKETDKTGELQVKGESIMKGYYKLPEKTKEVFTQDGWLRTGDLGFIDKNNILYIKGRLKTMILGASGENIYPEEIESVINKMDLVMESLVAEQGGKLVAMVHLNMEELEKRLKTFQNNVLELKKEAHKKRKDFEMTVEQKAEEILSEIHIMVNRELNKFSQIQKMVLQPVPFEKTPTHKVKRFLYT